MTPRRERRAIREMRLRVTDRCATTYLAPEGLHALRRERSSEDVAVRVNTHETMTRRGARGESKRARANERTTRRLFLSFDARPGRTIWSAMMDGASVKDGSKRARRRMGETRAQNPRSVYRDRA